MEDIKLSISLKIKNMYIFQMKHAYHGVQGIVAILISVVSLIFYAFTHSTNQYVTNLMLIFAGLLFTVFVPFKTLYSSFKIIALTPVFRKPLDYCFCEEGIKVSQDGDEALLPWEAVIKVDEFMNQLHIYSSPRNGYILPNSQLKDHYEEVKKIIRDKTDDDCELKLKEAVNKA